nr:uncharacterized protein LOC111984251 [Quercus suber]
MRCREGRVDNNDATFLHKIDLRGKVGVNWMRRHAVHIVHWGNCLQRHFEVVLGEMPPQHEYFGWFNRVTRRFIDRPGAKLTMLVSLVNRLSRQHPVGMEEHKDIAQVLTAVHHMDRVQPPIPEALNEEATTPAGPSTTEGPSTSTTPTKCPSRPLVATPQVVPTPDSSPYTPYASPSFTIPAFPSHSSPTLTIPSYTHPSPSFTIPAFTSHPSPTLTIPSSNPHPSSSPTIPHPSPSLTIPHPAPRPTIPPPTPHPCHRSDIRPPFPQSFPELSPIPSFDLGLHPTPPEMQ